VLNLLVIAVGAAIGANLRYGLTLWAAGRFGAAFPYGTLIVNLLGCLLIGALLTLAAARLPLSEPIRLLLVTGLLGGFTTFSSFGWEAYGLALAGDWALAALYVAGSVGLGLGAVLIGAWAARLLAG
jgi:fluoride exporter